MYCKHCGTALPDDTRFCTGCGTQIGEATDSRPSAGGGASAALSASMIRLLPGILKTPTAGRLFSP